LATTLFAVAFSISDRPFVSRFQWIAAFLAFYPSVESRLIDRQVENLRPAHQFAECFHDLRRGGKNNLVHNFRLALASARVEIDPASIRAKDKHPLLCEWIVWGNARLGHQIRTTFVAGTQIQYVSIPIIIGNRSHS